MLLTKLLRMCFFYDYFAGVGFAIVALILIAFLIFLGTSLRRAIEKNPSESEIIETKLEANPFDEEALQQAIEYNAKVWKAKEHESYGVESDNEQYLTEDYIDIDKYQIEYIDEHFGLENIMERVEKQKASTE